MARTGGQLLIDQLQLNGAKLAFGVPGESYLHALDAMHGHNALKFVICRQEGGAAMMAEAYGKLTNTPGICFVTRGPGATNASAGLHIARQDSTPMILFVGQIARDWSEREAFQEIDYRRMFGEVAKWVAQIDDASRIPEFVHRAYATAMQGRPGPVVLALPEDMLAETASVADGKTYQAVEAAPNPHALDQLETALKEAQKPLVILGGGGWNGQGIDHIRHWIEANDLPTTVSFRRQDYLDNRHHCYVGDLGIGANPTLLARLEQSDLLVVIGARLGEMTTDGFTRLGLPRTDQKLVHIHNGAEELGRVYQPDIGIIAGMNAAAEALAARPPLANRPWAPELGEMRASYAQHTAPTPIPGDVQMGTIMGWLRERLPEDAIMTNGAGNYCSWPNRYYHYRGWRSQLAPTSGSMGYGLPAAVAAKIAEPDKTVVCFAGDGCFMMHGQEFATAIQYNAPIIVILVDNGMYGTIRMHQERHYPGRVSGTELRNPDWVALAQAYGGFGVKVTATEQFADAFEQAVASGIPSIISIHIDPEAITPKTTLTAIREAASAKIAAHT